MEIARRPGPRPPKAGSETERKKEKTMAQYYTKVIRHTDGFTFTIPGLKGFMVQSDANEFKDAVAEAESVLADYLGAERETRGTVPEPLSWNEAARVITKEEEESDLAHDELITRMYINGYPRAKEPVRVNISLASDVLAVIDATAKARGLTRSAYLAEAAMAHR